jgi:hypothetical protein
VIVMVMAQNDQARQNLVPVTLRVPSRASPYVPTVPGTLPLAEDGGRLLMRSAADAVSR